MPSGLDSPDLAVASVIYAAYLFGYACRHRETHFIERDLLQLLAKFPLTGRLELTSFSDWSERAVYQRLGDLKRAGLVEDLSHASELIRPTRRFLLTADGIAQLALNLGRAARRFCAVIRSPSAGGRRYSGGWIRSA